jgi:hypothetical protein
VSCIVVVMLLSLSIDLSGGSSICVVKACLS